MLIEQTSIADVLVFKPQIHEDERGYFFETFRQSWFDEKGVSFVQENQSKSVKHVLRGLHYQIKRPQGKLVRVIRGKIFDVAVDMRVTSPNFGHWVGVTLSETNRKALWVPPGFAHGFLVVSEYAEVAYKCTDYYAPEYERCLRYDDEQLGIEWPIIGKPTVSEKDGQGDSFFSAHNDFVSESSRIVA